MLRRDDDSVLRVALDLEVSGKRKRGRPKKTWKKLMEEETEKIGFEEGGYPGSKQSGETECKQLRKEWSEVDHIC